MIELQVILAGISCDIRIASKTSLLGLPETALAIIPGAGGTQKLTRLIGLAKAKELVFTAARLSADEALAYGILNYVEEDYETAYLKALTIAEKILKNVSCCSGGVKHSPLAS